MADSILYDLARSLLDHIVSEVGEGNVPERRFVHHGEVADDECSQLVVAIGQMYVGFAGNQLVSSSPTVIAKRSFDLTVSWFRCVPSPDEQGQPPSVSDLEIAAHEIGTDGFRLFKAVQSAKKEVFGTCSNVLLGAMRPYGPSGGHGGWLFGIGVEL